MEATCFSETSVDFRRSIRRYITEDNILDNQLCSEPSNLHDDDDDDDKVLTLQEQDQTCRIWGYRGGGYGEL
jgi:hypothetical protein